MAKINNEKNIHAGHRQRMKKAMREHGLEPFNDIQVLEALLFYAIPNGDTNPTAHRLLDRFGSFRAVLEADFIELQKVKGIGENAANLICFSKHLCGYYTRSLAGENGQLVQMKSCQDLCDYYEKQFLNVAFEQVWVMGLDDSLFVVREEIIAKGDFVKVNLSARQLADFCNRTCCSRIVLAHNHPNGAALPSAADTSLTRELAAVLKVLEIELVDHIIIGKSGSFSFKNSPHASVIWQNLTLR